MECFQGDELKTIAPIIFGLLGIEDWKCLLRKRDKHIYDLVKNPTCTCDFPRFLKHIGKLWVTWYTHTVTDPRVRVWKSFENCKKELSVWIKNWGKEHLQYMVHYCISHLSYYRADRLFWNRCKHNKSRKSDSGLLWQFSKIRKKKNL